MKKIIFIILILFANNVLLSKQFTIKNDTEFTLQPFLDPVEVIGTLPDGITTINYLTVPGYINEGKIKYIEPKKSLILKLDKEERDQLDFDFSTALKFFVQTNTDDFFLNSHIQKSNEIDIQDNATYIISFDDLKKNLKVICKNCSYRIINPYAHVFK